MSIRISDPRPPYCSACHNTTDGRYVDFDAVHDGGSFVDRETHAYIEGTDDLHVCEACMRDACEVLGFKPELQRRQFTEIRRQELIIEGLRDQNQKLKAALAVQVPGDEPVRRGPGRPRKAVAA